LFPLTLFFVTDNPKLPAPSLVLKCIIYRFFFVCIHGVDDWKEKGTIRCANRLITLMSAIPLCVLPKLQEQQ
jgi:hypothetical protein